MDRLNEIIRNYLTCIECYDVNELVPIKILSEMILNFREPKYRNRIKNRYGLSKSIKLSHYFFNNINTDYATYFLQRLNEHAYFFREVKDNSLENAYSYFDESVGEKKIYIPYHNDLIDAFTIVHETFHDMNCDVDNLSITRNLFTEFISMYGEFLLEDFIGGRIENTNVNNNFCFNACFLKALKVDFQVSLIKCVLEYGVINDYNFSLIINSYDERYKKYLLGVYSNIVSTGYLNFIYETRYLYGILLACYSKTINLDNDLFMFINDNINDMDEEYLFSLLDLELKDNYRILLSNDSYEKLNNSYRKVMKSR